MGTPELIVDVDSIVAQFPQHGVVDETTDVPADLRELWSRRSPLILRGLVRRWPAFERWSFATLAEKGAGVKVDIARSIREQYGTVTEQRDLGEFLRAIEAGDGNVTGGHNQSYLYYSRVLDLIPELRDDIPFDEAFGRWSHKQASTWIGPAGTVTGLHSDDIYPNVLAQIRGRKDIVFFGPGSQVYPNGKYEFGTSLSEVDLQRIDFDRHPALRTASPLVAHLDEGDAVYNPPHWWHFVTSQTPSISVTTFYGSLRHVGPTVAKELAINVVHRAGLYKKGHCTCHAQAVAR